MKVLFAVSNEGIYESIIEKYKNEYKENISGKNVYYFNAIIKELQKDKNYDSIVVSEDLEPFTNKNHETIDNFIIEKLERVTNEATNINGQNIPIILIAMDRRLKGESILKKLYDIGIYSALIGADRSVEKVCQLINEPRTKNDAKSYYKINIEDQENKAQNDQDVSEVELQNILNHYKRLGRNEDQYVESFNKIASQYTDEQLKVIVGLLPIRVKAVLEAESPKYQQIASFKGESASLKKQAPYKSSQVNPKTNKPRSTDQAIVDNGIKIEAINSTQTKKPSKPVVIPEVMSTNNVKKIQRNTKKVNQNEIPTNNTKEIKNTMEKTEEIPVRKGRGRPKKVVTENNEAPAVMDNNTPKRRGRPKKVVQQDVIDEELPMLPGFDDESQQNNIQTETQIEENVLPGFDFDSTDDFMSFEEPIIPKTYRNNNNSQPITLDNGITNNNLSEKYIGNEKGEEEFSFELDNQMNTDNNNMQQSQMPSENIIQNNSSSLNNLVTSDKKIVAFIGTPKNGTSFLINNVAEILSKQGIKTAILDLTKNRNSYYIYTKNDENLRRTAIECTNKLLAGIAHGIEVNKCLDVYTSLPNENDGIDEYEKILGTLAQNYSLILLDCDFNTNYGYINEAQEIYLVQSMDVLTIQPLTAYLRDLKTKNILNQEKLRIVINKYTRVRSVTERTIIGGMAFYNDPAMSFMTELFNRDHIKYTVIPFDVQTYSKYLEGLVNCSITTNGYSKEFIGSLKKLTSMVYPMLANVSQEKYNNPKYNKFSTGSFNSSMNSTLDKMKNNY